MTLADIQNSINQANDTKQALQTVDAINLPAGTVLQHKQSGGICIIRSSYMHYIDGLIYDTIDENGNESWLVHSYNLSKLYNIINK